MRWWLTTKAAVFVSLALAAEPNPGISVQTVKFPELVKAIQAHRGKVVVVDFWADY
jgi:thiol:disulfide interchange protein